ncbi:hypothetical protein PHLCEN_2v11093, partial [Hermanssonia centrifuga]
LSKLKNYIPARLRHLHPPNLKVPPIIVTIQLHNKAPSGHGLDVAPSWSLAVEPASSFNLGSRLELKAKETKVATTFRGWVSGVEELQTKSVVLRVTSSGKGKGDVMLHIPYHFVKLPWYTRKIGTFRAKFNLLPEGLPLKYIEKRTIEDPLTF